jgi:hypothetical protein
MDASDLFQSVIDVALSEVQAAGVAVFTFALYHDHESAAISVCVDTEESSLRSVQATNRFNMKYFIRAVEAGDLKGAELWQSNIGRSLALGDFHMVNVARRSLGNIPVGDQFHLKMVQTLVANQSRVASLSPNPERLILACSGADDEVAYVWSLPSSA